MTVKYTLALRPEPLSDTPAPAEKQIQEILEQPDNWTESDIETDYFNWVSNHVDGTWEKVRS